MASQVGDNRNKVPPNEDDDLTSKLEYLSRRVSEEKRNVSEEFQAKGEELEGLRRLGEEVDWALDAVRFVKRHIGQEPNYPYLSTYPPELINQFDKSYPPGREIRIGPTWHTSGSPISTVAYAYLSDNPTFFEPEEVYDEYRQKLTSFEHRRNTENRRNEVYRRLCWLDENAAYKFDSAWKSLTVGANLPDPGEGPTMLMRSVIDITVERLYKRVPQPPKRLVKGERLKYIAQHVARDALARERIITAAARYVELTSKLSKFKEITDANLSYIRSLLYQGQDLLFDILDSIEYQKLASR
jgi:hypothetical protein